MISRSLVCGLRHLENAHISLQLALFHDLWQMRIIKVAKNGFDRSASSKFFERLLHVVVMGFRHIKSISV